MSNTVPEPPPSTQGPLDTDFSSRLSWLAFPEHAFALWLQRHSFRDSTCRVYRAMWGNFIAWCREKNVSFYNLPDMLQFLNDSSIKKEHRWRYIRLVERVINHISSLSPEGTTTNPEPTENAAKKAGIAVGKDKNADSRFLTQEERVVIMRQVEESLEKVKLAKLSREDWLKARDVALIGVMLGGGLKVNQAQEVTVNCIKGMDGPDLFDAAGEALVRIELTPLRGRRHGHHARVLPFAVPVLAAWHQLRLEEEDGDDRLFPAQRDTGGPKPKFSDAPMNQATVFRRCRDALNAIGVTGSRACPQTLRNTYSAILIESGATDEELAECLGIGVDRSIGRLRHSHKAWAARQPLEEIEAAEAAEV